MYVDPIEVNAPGAVLKFELVCKLLRKIGIAVIDIWMTSSEEDGVFLFPRTVTS